jgi:hypothetical protein
MWGVLAANHCHPWWSWWSDTLWVTLIRFWLHSFSLCLFWFTWTDRTVTFKVLLWSFLCNLIDRYPLYSCVHVGEAADALLSREMAMFSLKAWNVMGSILMNSGRSVECGSHFVSVGDRPSSIQWKQPSSGQFPCPFLHLHLCWLLALVSSYSTMFWDSRVATLLEQLFTYL